MLSKNFLSLLYFNIMQVEIYWDLTQYLFIKKFNCFAVYFKTSEQILDHRSSVVLVKHFKKTENFMNLNQHHVSNRKLNPCSQGERL